MVRTSVCGGRRGERERAVRKEKRKLSKGLEGEIEED